LADRFRKHRIHKINYSLLIIVVDTFCNLLVQIFLCVEQVPDDVAMPVSRKVAVVTSKGGRSQFFKQAQKLGLLLKLIAKSFSKS